MQNDTNELDVPREVFNQIGQLHEPIKVYAECGQGLHFGPTPAHALAYLPDATRFVAVGVELATLRPIPGGTAKCKAPKVVRACVEVDLDGNEVES